MVQGPNLIINQPDELLDSMSDWCKEHHGKVLDKFIVMISTSASMYFLFRVVCVCVSHDALLFGVQSGLTQAVRNSKISLQQAEYEFISFVRQHTPPGQCPLAGKTHTQSLSQSFK